MPIESSIPLPTPRWEELYAPAPNGLTAFPVTSASGMSWANDVGLRVIQTDRAVSGTFQDYQAQTISSSGTGAIYKHVTTGIPVAEFNGAAVYLISWRHPRAFPSDRDGGPQFDVHPIARVQIIDLLYSGGAGSGNRDGAFLFPGPQNNNVNSDHPTNAASDGGMTIQQSGALTQDIRWYDTGGALIDSLTIPAPASPSLTWIRAEILSGRPGTDARIILTDQRRNLTLQDRTFDGVDLPRYLSRGGLLGNNQGWYFGFGQDNTGNFQRFNVRIRWGRFRANGAPVGDP